MPARNGARLTTAASVWATASSGVAAGRGREATAVLATVPVLLILAIVPRLERRYDTGKLVHPAADRRPPPE